MEKLKIEKTPYRSDPLTMEMAEADMVKIVMRMTAEEWRLLAELIMVAGYKIEEEGEA